MSQSESTGHSGEYWVWQAEVPSNIAFQKYWGKRDAKAQWPTNDSISMTLSASKTTTQVSLSNNKYHSFAFDGQLMRSDLAPDAKVFKHINLLRDEFASTDFLNVTSTNTFPGDCGIASSASGYGALTLAVVCALTRSSTWHELALKGIPRERLAHLARMGSGSASRSLFGGFVHWMAGDTAASQQINELDIGTESWNLADLIVVVSDEKKAVGSSAAHLAAPTSPFFQRRIENSAEITKKILEAIKTRQFEQLGSLIEAECLDMHAVAATGSPSIQYLNCRTIDLIEWLRYRRHEALPAAYFTIDAGPNPHIICEEKNAASLMRELQNKWPDLRIIRDKVGLGPNITVKKTKDSETVRANSPTAFFNAKELKNNDAGDYSNA